MFICYRHTSGSFEKNGRISYYCPHHFQGTEIFKLAQIILNEGKQFDRQCKKCLNYRCWGCSSVGRALEWHSRGRRFDPVQLHLTFSITYLPLSLLIPCLTMQ